MQTSKLRAKLAALEREAEQEKVASPSRASDSAESAAERLHLSAVSSSADGGFGSALRRAGVGVATWPKPLQELLSWESGLRTREEEELTHRQQCEVRSKALKEKCRWVRETKARLERQQRDLGISDTLLTCVELPQSGSEDEQDATCPTVWRLETDSQELYRRKVLHRDLERREQSLKQRQRRLRSLPLKEAQAARFEQKLLLLERDIAHALDARRESDRAANWLKVREKEVVELEETAKERVKRAAADERELRTLEHSLRRRAADAMAARPTLRGTAAGFRPDRCDRTDYARVHTLEATSALAGDDTEVPVESKPIPPASKGGPDQVKMEDSFPDPLPPGPELLELPPGGVGTVHDCRRLHDARAGAAAARDRELQDHARRWRSTLQLQDTDACALQNRRHEIYDAEIKLLTVRRQLRE
eukprot:TRINITY_DN7720_c0_g2_i1.p1 TRINITY_DN7720_c0_g2~~TRINITY_DN7720_c0_g2_i1.p1  ORF type:complete len:421 (+),score=124.49 TRINITY_DN7720_c0_g2_i1:64-1326(+)